VPSAPEVNILFAPALEVILTGPLKVAVPVVTVLLLNVAVPHTLRPSVSDETPVPGAFK
jgi:hypothetical protein